MLLALVGASFGCQRGPNLPDLLPVQGTVRLGDELIREGAVSFHEEGAQAGTGYSPTGTIDEDGKYELFVHGQPGCPAGKYRVVVFANERITGASGGHAAMPKSIIDRRYNDRATTPLRVEVREDAAAGDYDLRIEP